MASDAAKARMLQELRARDKELYIIGICQDRAIRDDVLTVCAFIAELEHIRQVTHEPLAGAMRLAWWRESLTEIYAGKRPKSHHILQRLAALIPRHNMPVDIFEQLIDACGYLLEEEGYPDMQAGEVLARNHMEPLLRAYAFMAVNHLYHASIAVAYGFTRLLRYIPRDLPRGKLWLPLNTLQAEGIPVSAAHQKEHQVAIGGIIRACVENITSRHINSVENVSLSPMEAAMLAIVDARIKRFRSVDYNPFSVRFSHMPAMLSWKVLRHIALTK